MSQELDYQKELSKCSTMADITGPDGLVQKIIVVQQIKSHLISHLKRHLGATNGKLSAFYQLLFWHFIGRNLTATYIILLIKKGGMSRLSVYVPVLML